MVIFSHPTGNQNARAAAYGLADANLLYEFHTTIASFKGDLLDQLSNLPALAEIRRRRFDSKIKSLTNTFPWFEVGRLISAKAGLSKLTQHETGLFSIDEVYRSIDKRAALKLGKSNRDVLAVYGYEDAAEISFTTAKKKGMLCLYDLPIGYWRSARKLLEPELLLRPDWAETLTGFKDSEVKLNRKDQELKMADLILVASSFTAKTLSDFPGELAPVEVIPYGFPPVNPGKDYGNSSGALKLLFVGGLSQRKGIANLFEAVKKFGRHVELTVVGGKPTESCEALNRELTNYKWIPSLPHSEILKIMQQHDVLVFPSLFEGFGLVITEAMSQGTPVITTERTAGPDLIKHHENGWIAEAGSTESLEASIEHLLQNRGEIVSAGKNALETARLRPWEQYGLELAECIGSRIKQ